MKRFLRGAILAVLLLTAFATPGSAQEPTVQAVLFFSPTCPHCQLVIEGTILPMVEQYGHRLEIIAVSTATPEGQELYRAAVERFEIPPERYGVPTLIVAETVLVGSGEIPEQFPAIVEAGLAQGGIAWPDIPGLAELLAAAQQRATQAEPTAAPHTPTAEPPLSSHTPEQEDNPDPQLALAEATRPTWQSNLMRDPLGSGLSIVVLIGMVSSIALVGANLTQTSARSSTVRAGWSIPILSLLGGLIAGYLAFVETTGSVAVCGPVGDCNTVQQSQYAVLFGVLPVGTLGVLGYLALILAWFIGRSEFGSLSDQAWLALFAMTVFGVIFSIYLTFLEPFVIGAICAWCLSSAVIMTAQMWLASSPARAAWKRIRKGASR